MRSNERIYWLWCCVGVFLAGCGQVMTTTTRTPTLMLLNLTRPAFTPTPILRLLRTPTLRASNTSMPFPVSTPLPLRLSPPDCYQTPVGSLWCLGLIRNMLNIPIHQVLISVYLVRLDGSVLAEKSTASANKIIAAGEISSYGVLFDSIPEGFAGPIAVLIGATQADHTPLISVKNVQTRPADSGYHVSGLLVSADSNVVHKVSIVVTLLDPAGRVTGFRQVNLPAEQGLLPGTTLPFELDVIPQGTGTSHVEVHVDGE